MTNSDDIREAAYHVAEAREHLERCEDLSEEQERIVEKMDSLCMQLTGTMREMAINVEVDETLDENSEADDL